MGYIVSIGDFPGMSLDGEEMPLGLETRRESFVLTHEEAWADTGGRIEIPNEWLPFLRLYVDYLERKRDGKKAKS